MHTSQCLPGVANFPTVVLPKGGQTVQGPGSGGIVIVSPGGAQDVLDELAGFAKHAAYLFSTPFDGVSVFFSDRPLAGFGFGVVPPNPAQQLWRVTLQVGTTRIIMPQTMLGFAVRQDVSVGDFSFWAEQDTPYASLPREL